MIVLILLIINPVSAYRIIKTNISQTIKYEFSVEFLDELWNIKLYPYAYNNIRQFTNIIVNNRILEFNINSYGIVLVKSKKIFLGYFYVNENNQLSGLVEMNNYNYYLINNESFTIVIISYPTEHILLNWNIYLHRLRKRLKSSENKIMRKCFVKVLIGPYLYNQISTIFTFRNEREKLSKIKLFVENIFLNVNRVFSKLPKDLQTIFYVKDLFVLTKSVCEKNFTGILWRTPTSTFCDENATPDDILNRLEEMYLDKQYCLTLSFLSHKEISSVLGYANMGSICRIFTNQKTLFINTVGLEFLFNSYRTSIIVSHEIGHTLNARHDDESDCKTNGSFNFIMNSFYSRTLPIFSNCSIKDMMFYIQNVDENICFSNSIEKSFCGNGILEDQEQCDCGNRVNCFCCNAKLCQLLPTSECSKFGLNGMCCNETICKWQPRSLNIICKYETECTHVMYCHRYTGCKSDGNFPIKKLCAKNSKICFNKLCKDSVCSLWNLNEYPSNKISKDKCLLHCFNNETGLIYSLSNLTQPINSTKFDLSNVFYIVGSSCIDGNRFCHDSGLCETLEGTILSGINIYLLINPYFYRNLSLSITNHLLLILFALIAIFLLCLLLFEAPYICEYVIIYQYIFVDKYLNRELINSYNYNFFLLFSHRKIIRMSFTVIEIEHLINDFQIIEQIKSSYNYLRRNLDIFPLNGDLLKSCDILKELINYT